MNAHQMNADPMNADQIEALLTEFTLALPKLGEALDVSDPKQKPMYVTTLHANRVPTLRLFKEIKREPGDAVYLFSGQPGSGKSTELLRLKSLLNDYQNSGASGTPLKPFKAYYVDLAQWLNVTEPLELGTLLVAIVAGWLDALGMPGVVAQPLHQRLAQFIHAPWDVNGLNFKGIQLSLQQDANVRKNINHKLSENASGFIQQIHSLTQEIANAVCQEGQQCVLMLDSLEKNNGVGEAQKSVFDSLAQIFVGHSQALRLLGVKTMYSVPPALVEQHSYLMALYGQGNLVRMPSVHVKKLVDGQMQDDLDDGIAGMQTMLTQRYPRWGEVFTLAQIQRLIVGSGGDLRDFYRAIRIALTEDVTCLPLPESAIDYALNQIRPPTNLLDYEIAWLAQVAQTQQPCLSEKIPPARLQHFLTTKHVLIYLNGDVWYAVHPLLQSWLKNSVDKQAATAQQSTA